MGEGSGEIVPHSICPQRGQRVSGPVSCLPSSPRATFNPPTTMWKAAFPHAFAPESLEAKRGLQLIMVSRGPLAIWHGLLLLLLLPLPSHGGPALRPPLPSQVQEWDRVLCPACVSVSYAGALPSSLLSSSGLVAMPLPPSVSGMSLFRLTFSSTDS